MNEERKLTVEDIQPRRIAPTIYYAERAANYLQQNFFEMDANHFNEDKNAKELFVLNYEEMGTQVHILSDMLFNLRVEIEASLGLENPQTDAFIRSQKELLSMYESNRNKNSAPTAATVKGASTTMQDQFTADDAKVQGGAA